MRLVYLAAPVGAPTAAGVTENLQRAKRWLRWAYLAHPDVSPIAPWITCCEVLDDANVQHRRRGLECDFAAIERCDELWLVGGRTSSGMELEAKHARKTWRPVWGSPIRIVDLTHLGDEPPEIP